MKAWLLTLLLLATGDLPGWRWLVRVRDHNEAQARGQAATGRGQASEAAYYFGQAVALSGRGGPAPTLLLAQAQAQAQAGQTGPAQATYSQLLGAAVPPAVGSTARQQLAVLLARKGQQAQALGLLRQALRLNPSNLAARYDYEVLGRYLAGHPTPPDSAATPPPKPPRPDSAAGGAKHAGRPAGGGQGQPTAAPQPQSGTDGAAPTPSPQGQPDQPGPAATGSGAGGNARGGRQPGSGPAQPLPGGSQPGQQRGLGPASPTSPGGTSGGSGRPGTEAATPTDAQLQTQRERLRAMSLTPAQAQQLLDALRASEQQYLQQRPHTRRGPAPAPGQPTW